MRDELLKQAQLAVELGLAAGADDVVAGVSWGRSLSYEWRDGRLETVQESTSRRLGLAVYVDGRFSTCNTNDLEPKRLKRFAEDTVELTRCLEADPFRKITPPELYEGRSEVDLDLVDKSMQDLTREQRIEWCAEMDEVARSVEGIHAAENEVSDSHGISARASSNGFAGTSEETSAYLYTKSSARDGDKRPEDYYYVAGTHLDELASAKSIAEESTRRTLSRVGAKPLPSVRTTMVLDPEAGGRFLGRIFGAMSAGAVQQKHSFLADCLEQPIASELLSITDEPLMVRGTGSQHYDGEGIACRPRKVIEKGVLRTFFVDTYYGRKLDWSPTTGGSSNSVFAHGNRDLAGILGGLSDGIYVTSWLGGNADMTTGDFSFGLAGHQVQGGELVGPVSEMNVTGNYRDILKGLVEVGNDPVRWSSFRAPTLVFENVQFSGL
jgi:PmbA protein